MSRKRTNIPDLQYDKSIAQICGAGWRNLPPDEVDGAIGIAIMKSVADGVKPEISEIASHLGVPNALVERPFWRLSYNGVFLESWVNADREKIMRDDQLALCFYAGWASGLSGVSSKRETVSRY